MQIATYLRDRKLTLAAFASQIGVHPRAVHRYVHGRRTPEREIMRRIVDATNGAVTPNDFFDLPDTPPPSDIASENTG